MASTFLLLYLLSLTLSYSAAGEHCSNEDLSPVEDIFGYINKTAVKRYTWVNKKDNITVEVITYGARIKSIYVPDKNGNVDDVLLGFDDLQGYLGNNPYFGAIQGRVGNRIAGANFTLNGRTYYLVPNDHGKHSLSGGRSGFDKQIWEPYVSGNKLILSYLSEDGENNFPGTVLTQVTYELKKNTFCFSAHAYVTKETPINILNHGHYNLAGQDAGPEGIYGHCVTINADKRTALYPDEVPTGEILKIPKGSIFDFSVEKCLGETKKEIDGYDHNYCINVPKGKEMHFVGRIVHKKSGRAVQIISTQPGTQFYSGIHLPKKDSNNPIIGKGGTKYIKDGAIFLETQHYPDAVHHPNFPSIIVSPDKPYFCKTCYEFYTE